MESASSNWVHTMLIDELTRGMEQAKQLRVQLSLASTSESQNLVQRIMSSYEKALFILKCHGSVGQEQEQQRQEKSLVVASTLNAQDSSSFSANGSPQSNGLNKRVNVSKKRKTSPTWSEQVRVISENGLEGPGEDGYSWRKYGQKDILGAKYPRSYYRCTYRLMHNCWATKQVQRSDDDPCVFELTYKGTHTCNRASNFTTIENQEPNHDYHYANLNDSQEPNQMLMNLRANLTVQTSDLEFQVAPPTFSGENHVYQFSPLFISPGTSESNYYSVSPCQTNGFGGFHDLHQPENPTGIFSASAATSSTNSPIVGLDFLTDSVGSDLHFPFNSLPGFFP